MNRKQEKERLVLYLQHLKNYCKPQYTRWPDFDFLLSLKNSVMLLIETQRKKPPSPTWKAFQILNKRMSSLRLVLRVDNLVKRARDRLAEAGESAMTKLRQQAGRGDDDAGKLLRAVFVFARSDFVNVHRVKKQLLFRATVFAKEKTNTAEQERSLRR